MSLRPIELQQRVARFLRAIEDLAPSVSGETRAQTLVRALLKACRDMEAGYRHACSSTSPDQFASRISVVARNAKKARSSLAFLTQLDYLPLASARDLIFEARGLENIFVAARNTAKRRQKARTG